MTITADVLKQMPLSDDVWAPWCYERPDGTLATCVGNSKALMRLVGNFSALEPVKYDYSARDDNQSRKPNGRAIDNIFAQKTQHFALSAAVEEWVALEGERKLPKPIKSKCDNCNGFGVEECFHCYQDMDCEQCDGTGRIDDIEMPPSRAVCVCGPSWKTWFDVRVICPLLQIVGDGNMTIKLANNVQPSLFIGDGWEMIVMPLTDGGSVEEKLYWPVVTP